MKRIWCRVTSLFLQVRSVPIFHLLHPQKYPDFYHKIIKNKIAERTCKPLSISACSYKSDPQIILFTEHCKEYLDTNQCISVYICLKVHHEVLAFHCFFQTSALKYPFLDLCHWATIQSSLRFHCAKLDTSWSSRYLIVSVTPRAEWEVWKICVTQVTAIHHGKDDVK